MKKTLQIKEEKENEKLRMRGSNSLVICQCIFGKLRPCLAQLPVPDFQAESREMCQTLQNQDN
jgi:hypothetical protein